MLANSEILELAVCYAPHIGSRGTNTIEIHCLVDNKIVFRYSEVVSFNLGRLRERRLCRKMRQEIYDGLKNHSLKSLNLANIEKIVITSKCAYQDDIFFGVQLRRSSLLLFKKLAKWLDLKFEII